MAPILHFAGSLRIKWHRPGTVFAHFGRAPDKFCLKLKSNDFNSNHRVTYDVWKAPWVRKSLNKSTMFYESNWHRWEATCICISMYCIYIDISLLETKNINTKLYILLDQLRRNNTQWTSAIKKFAVLSNCGFHLHHCQSQQSFLL